MAHGIYMNNLLNQTGSLSVLSHPNCTGLSVMVPVSLQQASDVGCSSLLSHFFWNRTNLCVEAPGF